MANVTHPFEGPHPMDTSPGEGGALPIGQGAVRTETPSKVLPLRPDVQAQAEDRWNAEIGELTVALMSERAYRDAMKAAATNWRAGRGTLRAYDAARHEYTEARVALAAATLEETEACDQWLYVTDEEIRESLELALTAADGHPSSAELFGPAGDL